MKRALPLALLFCTLPLTAARTASADDQPEDPATKSFTYKKTRQANLEIIIHYPRGWKETDKRPGIVFFFSGGWTGGLIEQFESQAGYLATRGMVAARADYRVKSRHGVTPKECVEDAKSAVRWMRQNAGTLGMDPDRIVAAGGSAGGHIAACTALTPGLDAKGENTKVSSKPNVLLLFNPVLRFYGIPPLMDLIGSNEGLSKALSPTMHLTKDSPPTLIFFGTDDILAPMGEEFVQKSKELGHRAELFTAKGQPHEFYDHPPWLGTTMQRADEFLVSLRYLDERPVSTASHLAKTAAKGWELYLWQKDGDTSFSLLPRTDRLKSDDEITEDAAKGIDAIRRTLDELKPGQQVLVVGKKLADPPPKGQATPIVEYGRKIGLKMQP
jgi:acetyl esterase/lipase